MQDFGIQDSGIDVILIKRIGACIVVRPVKAVRIFLLPMLLSSLVCVVGWFAVCFLCLFKLGDQKFDAVF